MHQVLSLVEMMEHEVKVTLAGAGGDGFCASFCVESSVLFGRLRRFPFNLIIIIFIIYKLLFAG